MARVALRLYLFIMQIGREALVPSLHILTLPFDCYLHGSVRRTVRHALVCLHSIGAERFWRQTDTAHLFSQYCLGFGASWQGVVCCRQLKVLLVTSMALDQLLSFELCARVSAILPILLGSKNNCCLLLAPLSDTIVIGVG